MVFKTEISLRQYKSKILEKDKNSFYWGGICGVASENNQKTEKSLLFYSSTGLLSGQNFSRIMGNHTVKENESVALLIWLVYTFHILQSLVRRANGSWIFGVPSETDGSVLYNTRLSNQDLDLLCVEQKYRT